MIADAGKARDVLRQIVGNPNESARLCKVKSVDDSKFTCVVTLLDNPTIEINNVRYSATEDSLNVSIPDTNAIGVMYPFQGGYFLHGYDLIKQHYQATAEESILDILLDFIAAIKAIQLTHPYGPTTTNGVININDFMDIETRLKKFYLK